MSRGLARPGAPGENSAIKEHNSPVATSLGSCESLAASGHGSTFRRANADKTLSAIPFFSSPIEAQRNSSNWCSKRNIEWIFGISFHRARRLSGQGGGATPGLSPDLSAFKPSRARGLASDSETTQSDRLKLVGLASEDESIVRSIN